MKHASAFFSLLCVLTFTAFGQQGDNPRFEVSTPGQAAAQPPSPAEPRQDQDVLSYENADLDFTFDYPADWAVEERQGRAVPIATSPLANDRERRLPLEKDPIPQSNRSDVMLFQILLRSPSMSTTTITIFQTPDNLDEWLRSNVD